MLNLFTRPFTGVSSEIRGTEPHAQSAQGVADRLNSFVAALRNAGVPREDISVQFTQSGPAGGGVVVTAWVTYPAEKEIIDDSI